VSNIQLAIHNQLVFHLGSSHLSGVSGSPADHLAVWRLERFMGAGWIPLHFITPYAYLYLFVDVLSSSNMSLRQCRSKA
jgi:hypothetical protein